jgi:hypothetical protein
MQMNRVLRASSPPASIRVAYALILAATIPMLGCGESGATAPESLRYGQLGSMAIELSSPVSFETGQLVQRLEWRSDGRWALTEGMRYRDLTSPDHDPFTGDAGQITAGHYAQWITQVNDNPGLTLFDPGLDPNLEPDCRVPASVLKLTLRDEPTQSERVWTRCADGFLFDLTPVGAGPDAAAARVANAATLARDFTIGAGYRSAYAGTLPFGTLAQGDVVRLDYERSRVITTAAGLEQAWSELGGEGEPPSVDFDLETVLIAVVGERIEAGTSLEVRRVLPVAIGTVVELVERIPGDFCSPAERRHYPYHLVVTPRLAQPIQFSVPIAVERVPCG